MITEQDALPIWIDEGFTAEQAREWMPYWAAYDVEEATLLAENAWLWHTAGFTAAQAGRWLEETSASDLERAIIGRVHGLGPDADQVHCPGLINLTVEDPLEAPYNSYGVGDGGTLLHRWATSGLADARILAFWHAGIPLAEALTGTHDQDALDVLAALNTPCPMLTPSAA